MKKNLEIVGSPLFPLEIGCPAFIQECNGVRRTSVVLSLENISQNEIQFETQNTNYLLHLTTKRSPTAQEVI